MNPIPPLLAAPLAAFLGAYIALYLLLKSPLKTYFVAKPNQRSMHCSRMPNFGGIGILAGTGLAWLLLGTHIWLLVALVFASLLAAVSAVNDLSPLPVWLRLVVQCAVSVAFVQFGFGSNNIWLLLLIVFTFVWLINLYNFMDGIDGLAGGMTIAVFSTFAIALYLTSASSIMVAAALAVAAASLAFLRWNLYPARLFMGDVGSTMLGFLAATFSLYGWQAGYWPLWFPVVALLPFAADATVTLLRRLFNGENVFKAHTKHYYQRLVHMGYSQSTVSYWWYAAMLLSASAGLALIHANLVVQVIGLITLALLVALSFGYIERRWRQFLRIQPVLDTDTFSPSPQPEPQHSAGFAKLPLTGQAKPLGATHQPER